MTTIAAPANRSRRVLRSIGAVLTGVAANFALAGATDLALIAAGVFAPHSEAAAYTDSMLLLALTYRVVYGISSCYLTAYLAPERPAHHAFVPGFVWFATSIVGAIAMWDVASHWYTLAIIAVTLPCAWIGGRLYERRAGYSI